jgi:ABC-2 type transport system permease protein
MAFFKWALKSFQRNLAYRLEYFVSLFNALLYIFIFTSVWSALFVDDQVKFGMTRTMMVEYAVFVTIIKSTLVKSRDLIGERVRTGEIAIDLIKPVYLPLMSLADSLGTVFFQIFSRSLPLIIVAFFMFDISMPKGFDGMFLLYYTLSFFIFNALQFLFGVAAFYITENFPLWLLNSASVSLLSGSIIPLDLLPDAVQRFAMYTPYPYIFYLPAMKLIKGQSVVENPVLSQLVVLVLCYLAGLLLYHSGKRNLQIQGG